MQGLPVNVVPQAIDPTCMRLWLPYEDEEGCEGRVFEESRVMLTL